MIIGRHRVDQSLTGLQVFPRLQHEHLFRPASPQSWRWYVEILLLHSSRLNLLSTQSQRRHTNARVFLCSLPAEFNESCVHTQQRGTVHILLLCAVLRHRCCWVPAAVDQYVARLVLSSNPPLLRSSSGTDGRTPDRFIDPSPHTMRAASIRVLSECLIEHGPTNYSTFRATCDICSSHIENWRHD